MHRPRRKFSEILKAKRRLASGIMEKENFTHGWFYEQLPGMSFYTPFYRKETKRHIPGPGDRMPTPKEVVEKLNELGPDCYVSESRYFIVQPDSEIKSSKERELPGGSYTYEDSDSVFPERLVPMELRTDGFVKMSSYYRVKDHIKSFIEDKDAFMQGGGLYKCGIMLYGPPGQGKTSVIRNLIKEEVPKDAIVIFCSDMPSRAFLKRIKDTLNDRLKIIVFEEMLTVVSSEKRLEKVLAFLDGEQSLNYTLVLATTNYPERLPGNIVDRPGRFDELYYFGHPKKDDLKNILTHYLGRHPSESEIKASEGLSSAAIQQSCIFAKIKKITLEKATAMMKKRSDLVKKDFAEQKTLGIGGLSSYPWDDDDA